MAEIILLAILVTNLFILNEIKEYVFDQKSKEKMRKPGSKGAPTADAFVQSAKTAKK